MMILYVSDKLLWFQAKEDEKINEEAVYSSVVWLAGQDVWSPTTVAYIAEGKTQVKYCQSFL